MSDVEPMTRPDDGLYAALVRHGMTRRAFLRFSAAMAAALALPATYAPRIAAAVEAAPRFPVIWLRGQGCGGEMEAFLAAAKPTIGELLLEVVSVGYLESLMAESGEAATLARTTTMTRHPNGYLAIVEGAIPTAEDGMACAIGGRPFRDLVREVSDGAIATIAVGSCAFDGGTAAASPDLTRSVGVADVVDSSRLIVLPGSPMNVDNLVATIVHYLTFGELPPADGRRRPYFAYGDLIHNQCERRAHYEFGEFALAWGDEGAQKGWCLYKLGCKGPETFANCATAQYASKTSWNIKAGHGCVGCVMPRFWDSMGPAYARLPATIPFVPNLTADQIGLGLVGAVGAVTVAHGAATYAREVRNGFIARRRAAQAARAARAADEVVAEAPAPVSPPDEPADTPGAPA